MATMGLDSESISVTDAYGHAWERLWAHFLPLMLIAIAYAAVTLVAGGIQRILPGIVGFAVQVFVVGPISFGASFAVLRAARGQDPNLADLLVPFERSFVQAALGYLLFVVTLTVGFALLIVPGIFLAVRLAFVPFLIVDENLDAISAFRESWRRTAAYPWQIFGAMALAIPILCVGLLLLGVGILPAGALVNLAIATLFLDVTREVGREAPLHSTID